jgi:hypothetical protein
MSYLVIYVCLLIVMSSTYCVVFLFRFFNPMMSFSELSIFDCPLDIL